MNRMDASNRESLRVRSDKNLWNAVARSPLGKTSEEANYFIFFIEKKKLFTISLSIQYAGRKSQKVELCWLNETAKFFCFIQRREKLGF